MIYKQPSFPSSLSGYKDVFHGLPAPEFPPVLLRHSSAFFVWLVNEKLYDFIKIFLLTQNWEYFLILTNFFPTFLQC
jgi:hypothetical protein